MASCFLPLQNKLNSFNSSEEQKKLAKKMKSKEYYSTLMLAKKLFTRFSFSWFPKKSNKDVEISSLLKKLYDNRPTSAPPAKSFGSVPISSTGEQGVKRIKVIITKQQLQELLSKEIQLEDVLLTSETSTTLLSCITSDKWKPELDSIPEGNEL